MPLKWVDTPYGYIEIKPLPIGQMPSGDIQWREAIQFIRHFMTEIMTTCNQQTGVAAKDMMTEEESTYLWYGYIADYILKLKNNESTPRLS
jgi:hypothetical protein